jgi:hypothetical protein
MGWTRTDDLDGTIGAEQVVFGYEGKTYSIDLAEKNQKLFHEMMALYVAKAAVIGEHHYNPEATAFEGDLDTELTLLEDKVEQLTPRPQRKQKTRSKRKPNHEVNSSHVRAWAKENGFTVTDRGRLSAQVMAAYEQAQES